MNYLITVKPLSDPGCYCNLFLTVTYSIVFNYCSKWNEIVPQWCRSMLHESRQSFFKLKSPMTIELWNNVNIAFNSLNSVAVSSAEASGGLYIVRMVVDGILFCNLTEHTLKPHVGDTVREQALRTRCRFGLINIKTPSPHLCGRQVPKTK